MNGSPPSQDEPDDVGDEYRRASALDPSRPSEAVRRAVLDHAAQLAAERAAKPLSPWRTSKPPAANHRWRRPTIFGSLAAAVLAGILIAPHFLGPRVPPEAALTGPQKAGPGEVAPGPQAPTVERAPAADRAPAAEQSSSAEQALAVRQAPAAGQAPSALADQPRVADSDSAMKSAARAARNASAPLPRAARLVDPAAALRRAAEIGDTLDLTALLDARRDIDARDPNGRTALMLATLHGQANAVDVLLAHGADPNAADAHGTTPLQAAVAGDQQAIIRSLQRAGGR